MKRENVWVDLAAIQQQLPQEADCRFRHGTRANQRRRTRKDLLEAAGPG